MTNQGSHIDVLQVEIQIILALLRYSNPLSFLPFLPLVLYFQLSFYLTCLAIKPTVTSFSISVSSPANSSGGQESCWIKKSINTNNKQVHNWMMWNWEEDYTNQHQKQYWISNRCNQNYFSSSSWARVWWKQLINLFTITAAIYPSQAKLKEFGQCPMYINHLETVVGSASVLSDECSTWWGSAYL